MRERAGRFLLGRFTLAALIGVVTLAGSVLTLRYDLWPGSKPDPETQLDASMSVLTKENRVTWGEYHVRRGKKRPARGQSIEGVLFYVQVEVHGLKRREAELRWFLYDRRSNRRLPASGVGPKIRTIAGTTSDRTIVPVWQQPPVDDGTYFLRFELWGRGALLSIADSPPFGPCRRAACGYTGD
jgi:hypothetical protein